MNSIYFFICAVSALRLSCVVEEGSVSQSSTTPKPTPKIPNTWWVPPSNGVTDNEIASRYPESGSCEVGGTFSTNEFGASICEYPAVSCPVTKYFVYAEGGRGVELCCNNNSACNYDPVKNYCHPDLKRCVDGSYFGCSEKAGPIFQSCL